MLFRSHARRTGTSHPFVAGIRAELVERGQLVTVTSRVGGDGRARALPETPARRDPEPANLPGPAVATPGEPDQPGEVAPTSEGWAAATSPSSAVEEFVNDDPRVQTADYLVAFTSALSRAGGFMSFDAERIGQLAGQSTWDAIEAHASVVAHWYETARKSRSGLRVIKGGAA